MSPPKTQPAHSPVILPGAVQFDMASAISGRTYRIFVHAPMALPPPQGYPVVVFTDGNLTFPLAATANIGFALNGGAGAVVVGVGYPADDVVTPFVMRTRDMTPPTPMSQIEDRAGLPSRRPEDYGGDAEFFGFLTRELRPAIAAGWAVDPDNQTLYGHSLGGLFTLSVLFAHPSSFRGFAASSPSIWWADRSVLKAEAGFVAKVEAGEAAPRVLIMAGGDEQAMPETLPSTMTAPRMRALLKDARMVDNAAELAGRLAAIKGSKKKGWKLAFTAFDDEDHMTVVPASVSRALTFALRAGGKKDRKG